MCFIYRVFTHVLGKAVEVHHLYILRKRHYGHTYSKAISRSYYFHAPYLVSIILWFSDSPTLICCPDCAESFSQHLEITSHILTSHAPCLGSPKTALKRSAMPHHYPASSYDDLPYISNIVVNSFQISSPYVSTSSQISNPVSLTVHISFNGTVLMTFSCCSPLIKLNQAHPQLNCSLPKDQAS